MAESTPVQAETRPPFDSRALSMLWDPTIAEVTVVVVARGAVSSPLLADAEGAVLVADGDTAVLLQRLAMPP
jgi:hypothetical protein